MALGLSPAQITGARAIISAYRSAGLNPVGGLAVALNESNLNPSAVGDAGSSYGLFQLHRGGALPAGWSAQMAENPMQNAAFAARAIGAGGRGLSAAALQRYQTLNFERPANPAGDMSSANLARAGQIYSALSGGAVPFGGLSYGAPSSGGGGSLNLNSLMASLGIGQGTENAVFLERLVSGLASGHGAGGGGVSSLYSPPGGAPGKMFGGSYIPGRTDYGVDFGYHGNQQVPSYALGAGTVAKIGSGWSHTATPYQTGNAIYVKLDRPVAGQPYMYYAEGTPMSGVHVGQRVGAGTPLMYNPGEVGVIPDPYTSTMYQTPQPTGIAFRNYLHSIGVL